MVQGCDKMRQIYFTWIASLSKRPVSEMIHDVPNVDSYSMDRSSNPTRMKRQAVPKLRIDPGNFSTGLTMLFISSFMNLGSFCLSESHAWGMCDFRFKEMPSDSTMCTVEKNSLYNKRGDMLASIDSDYYRRAAISPKNKWIFSAVPPKVFGKLKSTLMRKMFCFG